MRKTRVLIDTNIFIQREDEHILPSNLQKLLRILEELQVVINIHPKSIEDIKRDNNKDRRRIMLSKLQSYPQIQSPPDPNGDDNFINIVGVPLKPNDDIDNSILYSVYKDAIDFLITQDNDIHKKASKLGINNRVLSLDEALMLFEKDFSLKEIGFSPPLKEEFVYNLSIDDSFFNSLKLQYKDFTSWFKKISREGRKCWVYFKEDGMIGALLIYKDESEIIYSNPPLPEKKRLKICTFKVTHIGHRIGELFIKLAIKYSIENSLSEIYLTHFNRPNDLLVDLVSEYGFGDVSMKENGEYVFIKNLQPDRRKLKCLQPTEISKKYYPYFYDGIRINKFIVPIRPEYHIRFFLDYTGRQLTLQESIGEFIVEGNTIKKAYICHSRTKKINSGDILLFYRSKDRKEITSLGVVEDIFTDIKDKNEIIRIVGKRTVYSLDEIEEIAKKLTMVILFIWNLHLRNPIKLKILNNLDILTQAPQSISQISHKKYLKIKKLGGIDENYTVN